MLSVETLKVRYGEIEAVRRVDLTIGKGEIVALVGANGAGKSTTLGAIAGLVRADSGKVTFDDTDITGLAPEAIARRGIALVPEGRHIFASLTVAENLLLGGAAHLDAAEARTRENELLDLFPVLRRFYRSKGGNLSGGEQQMLAIARALMGRPRMLLVDEPSLGLAPQLIDTVFDLIARLRLEGLTILLVEQNVALALEIADRATVLANGEVVLAGIAAELASSDLVREAYLGVSA
jgi:branched-chain amino acid transport system ATP-binding protein